MAKNINLKFYWNNIIPIRSDPYAFSVYWLKSSYRVWWSGREDMRTGEPWDYVSAQQLHWLRFCCYRALNLTNIGNYVLCKLCNSSKV